MSSFIHTTETCDHEQRAQGAKKVLSSKIVDWSDFQDHKVRSVGESHPARIDTSDGIEADPFGDWARKSTHVMRDQLERLLPGPPAQLHLTATLARSLRYLTRANLKQVVYQAHPLRRDFCMTFDLAKGGASNNEMLDVIREIRGIHRGLEIAAGGKYKDRLRLLELELPLLGGRLWTSQERERYDDERWLRLACGRLNEYRDRASALRRAVARCIFEEDKLRLTLDLDRVRDRLMQDLGLRTAKQNETERELIREVASVTDAAIGLPVVRALLIGGRMFGRRLAAPQSAYQKFVYREFIGAWRKSFA